jgi:inorganic pyrophosphatase
MDHGRLLAIANGFLYGNEMPSSLTDLDPGPNSPKVVRMIVEIPKNSPHKYEYDKKMGVFRLDRSLYSPMHYPGDYGFIPGTLAEDGDPMDVLVWVEQPSFSGCLIDARPVGILRMVDQNKPDTKILAVPDRNPRYNEIHSIDQVFPHVRQEIEYFFEIYKELEEKKTEIKGWRGPQEAWQAIREGRKRFLKAKGRSRGSRIERS